MGLLDFLKKKGNQEIVKTEDELIKEEIVKLESYIKESFRKMFLSITKASEDFLFKEVGEFYSIDIDNVSYQFKRPSGSNTIIMFELHSNDFKTFKSFNIVLQALAFNKKIITKEASFVRYSGYEYKEYIKDLKSLNDNIDDLNVKFLNQLNLVQSLNKKL